MVTILQKNIMVRIDDVYQKVLAIANKEQRGYITPQEFNLFANQAQLDIFEQYFYDINQFSRIPGNSTEYSDMLDILNEKISIFEESDSLTYSTNYFELPENLYRLGTVIYDKIEVEQVNENDLLYINSAPLTKPTLTRPVFTQNKNRIYIYPQTITRATCTYIKQPSRPSWNYVVVNDEAMYNPDVSVNFELHPSEEVNLVNKILQYAGILMNNELYQVGSQEEIKDIQQEKA